MKLVVLLSEMVERDWRILRCLVQGGPFELKHSLQFFIFLTLFFAGCASDSEFGDGSSLGNSSRSRTTTRVTGENSPTSNSLPNAGLTTQTQNVFTQGEIRIAHLDIRGKRMYRDSFLKQAQSIICNSNPQNVRWSKVPENQSQFELIPEPEKPCQAVVSIPQDILPLPANPILGKVVAKYQAVEGVAVTTEFPIRYQPPISLENYAMGYWATGDIYGYTCSRAAGNEPNIEFDISRIEVKDEYGSKDLLISGSCSLSFNRSADTDYVDPDYGSKDYRSNCPASMVIALDSNGKPAKLRAVFRKHQGSPFLAGKFLNFQDEQAFDHETMRFYVVGMTPDGKMGTSEPIGFFRVLHEKHQSRDPGGGIWNTVLGGLAGARLDPIGVIAGAIIGSNQ